MTISLTISTLFKSLAGKAIPAPTLAYFQTRNRMRIFDLVHREFERSEITQTELAVRLGKGKDRISRLLGAPGNWTLDTISDLLFAISGAAIKYEIYYPLERSERQIQTKNAASQLPMLGGGYSTNIIFYGAGFTGAPKAYVSSSETGTVTVSNDYYTPMALAQ